MVLNQKVRPFTAKWHRASVAHGLDSPELRTQFREELREVQSVLRIYTGMLAQMAGVEDLTRLED